MNNLQKYIWISITSAIIGGFCVMMLLLGHMHYHDELYHTPTSNFTTNGVTPHL